MRIKNFTKLLFPKTRRPLYYFSQQTPKKGMFDFVKSAWNQTFPSQQDNVKLKYQKIKQQKRLSPQQLQKIQKQTPQYLRSALVETQSKVKEQKQGFKISNLIPESIKSKIKETPQYKQYQIFKQNFKEYASTREGVIANAGTTIYSTISQGSNQARATQLMRQYIPSFSIYQLQQQSTVIFKNAYQSFLNEKISQLQIMVSDQAYQFLSAYIKLNKSKKWKPKYNQIIFNYPSQLQKARVGETQIPKFDFTIKIMELYCFVNSEGEIIQGGEDRVNESVFQFTIVYTGQHIGQLGHPWSICEIKKLQQMKMLV